MARSVVVKNILIHPTALERASRLDGTASRRYITSWVVHVGLNVFSSFPFMFVFRIASLGTVGGI